MTGPRRPELALHTTESTPRTGTLSYLRLAESIRKHESCDCGGCRWELLRRNRKRIGWALVVLGVLAWGWLIGRGLV